MTTNQRFYTSWTLMMTAAIVVISANSIFVPATSYIARDLGVAEAVMSSNMVFSRTGMIVCMFCFAAFADLFTSRRLAQAGLVICTVSCVLTCCSTVDTTGRRIRHIHVTVRESLLVCLLCVVK